MKRTLAFILAAIPLLLIGCTQSALEREEAPPARGGLAAAGRKAVLNGPETRTARHEPAGPPGKAPFMPRTGASSTWWKSLDLFPYGGGPYGQARRIEPRPERPGTSSRAR